MYPVRTQPDRKYLPLFGSSSSKSFALCGAKTPLIALSVVRRFGKASFSPGEKVGSGCGYPGCLR